MSFFYIYIYIYLPNYGFCFLFMKSLFKPLRVVCVLSVFFLYKQRVGTITALSYTMCS